MLELTATPEYVPMAACRGANPDIFHPCNEDGTPLRRHQLGQYDEARRICATCPVRLDCGLYAVHVNEKDGMWGALMPHERRQIRQRLRKRGLLE